MAVTLQNLRSFISGSEPTALLPGQLCYNLADRIVYVGDGTSVTTSFDGTTSPGVAGQGWYSMPMDFSAFKDYFVANPQYYGDIPTDNQVLTWSTSLNHPIWTSGGGGGGGAVYEVTNNQVAVAPGITVSDKIISATGVVSPDEGDTCIVQGLPGEVYQGLYIFTTEWVRAASYAYPTAAQVTYDPTVSGLPAINVQVAVDSLDVAVTVAQNTANTANSTANSAQATALAALPKAGGTMTGVITFAPGQIFPVTGIQDASLIQKGVVQGGGNMIFPSSGVIDVRGATISQTGVVQLTNSTTTTSATLALTATGAKSLQDQIDNLTLANSVTLAGTLNAATGIVDSVTPDGTAAGFTVSSPLPSPSGANQDYYVIVSQGGNYNPPGGGGPYSASSGDWFLSNGTTWQYLGVGSRPAYASTTTPGIVQLADNASTQSGTSAILAVTPVGLQSKLSDSTSTTSSTTIASSTAVKSAYDLANAALPKAGGTMTGGLCTQTVNVLSPYSITFASGTNGSLNAISDATNITSSTTAASSTALKAAYDLAADALPRAGGTMTGDLTFSGGGVGINFQGGSVLNEISDSVALTSSITAASSTAVKSAYDLANAALPLTGGTMTGAITFVAGQIFPVSGIQDATTGQKGVVQVGTNIQVSSGTISVNTATTSQLGVVQVGSNIQVSSGTISVNSASTTQSGVVQLNDTTSSTSTTEALTANQGYNLQQQINALSVSNNLTFAGTIDGSTGFMLTVTTEGAALTPPFVVGAPMPVASAGNSEYFTIVTVPGTMTPPGGSAQAVKDGDWWLSNGTSYTYLDIGYSTPYASTTACGVVLLATNAQTQAGVNTTTAVVPSALQSKMSDSTSTTSSTTIASSTAVKSAYDLANTANTTANAAIPKATYTAFGDLVAGTGAGTYGVLPIGTNGQALVVDTACPQGLKWGCAIEGYTCSSATFNTALGVFAGDSITSGTGNTVSGYNAGTALTSGGGNTFVGCASGSSVSTGNNNTIVGNVTGSAGLTGNLILAAGSTVKFQANSSGAWSYDGSSFGSSGQALVSQGSGTTPIWCSLACVPCSAFSASGQLLAGTGASTFTAVTVGTNGQFLTANSACTGGLEWVTECFVDDATYTGVGAIVAGTGVGTYAALPVGTNGQVLVPNSSCSTGLEWITVGALCIQGYTCASTPFNTALGYQAGDSITSGTGNTNLGYQAGTAVTTGGSNTFVGWVAGASVTTGAQNVAVGVSAGTSISTGIQNTLIGWEAGDATNASYTVAIGSRALGVVHTQNGTVAIGYSALAVSTSGSGNTAVGFQAACSVTTGGTNTVFGYNAGRSITTANSNTLIGWNAGSNSSTLTDSVAVGYNALSGAVVSGLGTVAIGVNALCAQTSGTCNTAVGYNAAALLTTGGCNIAIGARALDSAVSGAGNVAVGVDALTAVTSADFNTAVGFGAADAMGTGSNNVSIGYSAHGSSNPAQQVAVGKSALQSSSATGSVGVGFEAALNSSTGLVTAIGYCALRGTITATCSTAIGYQAGIAATGGGHTLIGHNAGNAITTGTNNTIVGPFVGSTTLDSNVVLANGAGTVRFQVNSSGAWSPDGTNFGTAGQHLASQGTGAVPVWTSSVPTVAVPASSAAAGSTGQIAADSTYFYFYTGGRWQRVAWDATAW